MDRQFHYFLAVPIAKEQKSYLHNWVVQHKDQYPFKSWVHQDDYHITLAFLGAVASPQQLANLKNQVSHIAQNHSPFELSLSGIDVFGKKESPRILWAGINESSYLHSLQRQVFHTCIEVGFSLDKKPFNPHITLARRWKSEVLFQYTNELRHIFEADKQTFLADKIHLYKTHLDRIPKYEAVEIFSLKG